MGDVYSILNSAIISLNKSSTSSTIFIFVTVSEEEEEEEEGKRSLHTIVCEQVCSCMEDFHLHFFHVGSVENFKYEGPIHPLLLRLLMRCKTNYRLEASRLGQFRLSLDYQSLAGVDRSLILHVPIPTRAARHFMTKELTFFSLFKQVLATRGSEITRMLLCTNIHSVLVPLVVGYLTAE